MLKFCLCGAGSIAGLWLIISNIATFTTNGGFSASDNGTAMLSLGLYALGSILLEVCLGKYFLSWLIHNVSRGDT